MTTKLIITLDDAEVAGLSSPGGVTKGTWRLAEMIESTNSYPDSQGATIYFADEDESLSVRGMEVQSS